MKICLAQTLPVTGDVQQNIEAHSLFIQLAATYQSNMIIFPELSLTGYEPALAKGLATDYDDPRFLDLQQLSDANKITVCAGMPLQTNGGLCIGMIIFQPHLPRQVYTKQYLHADEEPFFVPVQTTPALSPEKSHVALAICYEISVPEHAAAAAKQGASVYIASVVKTAKGVANAMERMREIAHTYSMTVLMANSVGPADDTICGGRSAIWNNKGELLGQLDDVRQGLLMIDTETQAITRQIVD